MSFQSDNEQREIRAELKALRELVARLSERVAALESKKTITLPKVANQ